MKKPGLSFVCNPPQNVFSITCKHQRTSVPIVILILCFYA